MTLIDEGGERSLDPPQLTQPFPYRDQFDGAQSFGFAAMLAVLKREELPHLLQAEAEFLGLTDEPQPLRMGLAVAADPTGRAARLPDEVPTLIVSSPQ